MKLLYYELYWRAMICFLSISTLTSSSNCVSVSQYILLSLIKSEAVYSVGLGISLILNSSGGLVAGGCFKFRSGTFRGSS